MLSPVYKVLTDSMHNRLRHMLRNIHHTCIENVVQSVGFNNASGTDPCVLLGFIPAGNCLAVLGKIDEIFRSQKIPRQGAVAGRIVPKIVYIKQFILAVLEERNNIADPAVSRFIKHLSHSIPLFSRQINTFFLFRGLRGYDAYSRCFRTALFRGRLSVRELFRTASLKYPHPFL